MNYTIWDKKSPIKGKDAEYVKQSFNVQEEDEIILISKSNVVVELQFKDILIANYNLDTNLTCEQVAQKYLEIKAQEELNAKNDNIAKEQQEELDKLKKQNADFENALVELAGMVGGA